MSNETDFSKLADKIEELLSGNTDNSWAHWSQYVLKAIEEISKDVKTINTSRETIQLKLAELTAVVQRIESSVQEFANFREKVIAPLRIKIGVFIVVSGLFGGIIATLIPILLKYLLEV